MSITNIRLLLVVVAIAGCRYVQFSLIIFLLLGLVHSVFHHRSS